MGEKSSRTFTKSLSPIPNAHTEYYLYNICTKVWQTPSLMQRDHPSLKNVIEQATEGRSVAVRYTASKEREGIIPNLSSWKIQQNSLGIKEENRG